jgi:hypothetical protein
MMHGHRPLWDLLVEDVVQCHRGDNVSGVLNLMRTITKFVSFTLDEALTKK